MATTRKTVVQDELHQFLVMHSLDCTMLDIDDIVLDYVITILEDLGNDEDAEENIDVDQFIEMMEAYVPGFGEIKSVEVCEWMFQLTCKLSDKRTDRRTRERHSSLSDELLGAITQTSDVCRADTKQKTGMLEEKKTDEVRIVREMFPVACSMEVTHCLGLASGDVEGAIQLILDRQESGDSIKQKTGMLEEKKTDEVRILREMFPVACSMEVTHCLGLASGDVEGAIQLILDRQESGDSIKQAKKKAKGSVLDDKDLKDTLIAKYSYVDADEHKKTFTPVVPTAESKKMVRYLENRIVTTKGEKFTEIKKPEDEDMKKTYVNLKPARKYRFH